MLSIMVSRVLNGHQPHHGWFCSFFPSSTTTNYPPLPSPSPLMLQTLPIEPAMSPSPPLRDVVSFLSLTSEDVAPATPPFPKGCGWLSLILWRIWGGRKTWGTHQVGFPNGESWNMNHNEGHGSLSLSLFLFPSLTPLTLPPGPTETPKQWQWGVSGWGWHRWEMWHDDKDGKWQDARKQWRQEEMMTRRKEKRTTTRREETTTRREEMMTKREEMTTRREGWDKMTRRQRDEMMRKPTTVAWNQWGQIKTNHGESKPTTANQNLRRRNGVAQYNSDSDCNTMVTHPGRW